MVRKIIFLLSLCASAPAFAGTMVPCAASLNTLDPKLSGLLNQYAELSFALRSSDPTAPFSVSLEKTLLEKSVELEGLVSDDVARQAAMDFIADRVSRLEGRNTDVITDSRNIEMAQREEEDKLLKPYTLGQEIMWSWFEDALLTPDGIFIVRPITPARRLVVFDSVHGIKKTISFESPEFNSFKDGGLSYLPKTREIYVSRQNGSYTISLDAVMKSSQQEVDGEALSRPVTINLPDNLFEKSLRWAISRSYLLSHFMADGIRSGNLDGNALSKDGRVLVQRWRHHGASADRSTFLIYNVPSSKEGVRHSPTYAGLIKIRKPIKKWEISSDGKFFAAQTYEDVRVYEVNALNNKPKRIKLSAGDVLYGFIGPNLVHSEGANKIVISNPVTGVVEKQTFEIPLITLKQMPQVKISDDGSTLYAINGQYLWSWDIKSGRIKETQVKFPALRFWISGDQKTLVAEDPSKTASIWKRRE